MSVPLTPASAARPAVPAPGAPRAVSAPAFAERRLVRAHAGFLRAVRLAPERLAWYAERSGRPALAGIALLAASAVFFYSTQQPIVADVARLKVELATAQGREQRIPASAASDAASALANLPARSAMPQLLALVLAQAADANLSLDSAKYEGSASKSGEIERYKVTFPVTGPYPDVRRFIDATLTTLPSAAIDDLRIERKAVGETTVTAHLRLSIYTRAGS